MVVNGSRPKGIRHPLAGVTDVRILSERKLGRFGAKQRLLSIDHLSGARVETNVHEIGGSDETLEPSAGAESRAAQVVSVADELAKLSSLQRSGVLSKEEFNAQKAKLLSDA